MAEEGILIVEDEPGARSNLSQTLQSFGHNNIFLAENLKQGISILSERGREIYVVLLDLMLPDGNGMDLMEYLVNSHQYIIGIIVITGFGDIDIATRFFRLGTENIVAADFQQKPIMLTPLIEQIQRTITLIKNKM